MRKSITVPDRFELVFQNKVNTMHCLLNLLCQYAEWLTNYSEHETVKIAKEIRAINPVVKSLTYVMNYVFVKYNRAISINEAFRIALLTHTLHVENRDEERGVNEVL